MFFPIYNNGFDERILRSLIDVIKNDGVVIIPTDTFYAFACDVNSAKAARRLADLKGKKLEKSDFSIICSSISQVSSYTKPISNDFFKLLKRNTPGAFTFVFEASSLVPKIFQNKKRCIGIRIPDCEFISELSKALDSPLLVSSLPTEGRCFEDYSNIDLILEEWEDKVDCIVGGNDDLNFEPSTVVSCIGEDIEIIREGCRDLIL